MKDQIIELQKEIKDFYKTKELNISELKARIRIEEQNIKEQLRNSNHKKLLLAETKRKILKEQLRGEQEKEHIITDYFKSKDNEKAYYPVINKFISDYKKNMQKIDKETDVKLEALKEEIKQAFKNYNNEIKGYNNEVEELDNLYNEVFKKYINYSKKNEIVISDNLKSKKITLGYKLNAISF